MHSYQLEVDELENASGLPNDLYLLKPKKRFEGSWVISGITDPGTTQMQVKIARYLPRWVYSFEENWNNDYRWSPESPVMQTRAFIRRRISDK